MKKIGIIFLFSILVIRVNSGSIRRFEHVRCFYEDLTEQTIKLGLKYNTPPAAILAIAGLESGYGEGYIAKITGNIMSLGANKGEIRLPALYLPNDVESNRIIYDQLEIEKYPEEMLNWEQRPASLKKDYRPKNIRGSKEELAYFKKHPDKEIEARLKNIEDFMKVWLDEDYKFEVFSSTRTYLDAMVREYGKEILFRPELNKSFINRIGGRKGSFNHRKSWVEKVEWIMNNAKLVELTAQIYFEKLDFETAWQKELLLTEKSR